MAGFRAGFLTGEKPTMTFYSNFEDRSTVQAQDAQQKMFDDANRDRQSRTEAFRPSDYRKLSFNTSEYWQAVKRGDISWEQAGQDQEERNLRRHRSLQSCHSFKKPERKRHEVPETNEYTPELSARVDDDKNLNASTKEAVRFLARHIYKKSRDTRRI